MEVSAYGVNGGKKHMLGDEDGINEGTRLGFVLGNDEG